MSAPTNSTCSAFVDQKKIASGELTIVAALVKKHLQKDAKANVLIFEDQTSNLVEIDLRGSLEAVIKRLSPEKVDAEKKPGPGRPKLGVTAREITLMPQHWDWLAAQPGGASVTLRKLVEEAKRKNFAKDRARLAQEATYKFMSVMAGDLPNFEEALRALYAKDAKKFAALIKSWPTDIREHTQELADSAIS